MLLLTLFSSLALASPGNCNLDTSLCNVQFNSVYDGDTFYVDIPYVKSIFGKKLGVRLLGVDTPEIRTSNPCEKKKGYEAKEFVSSKLSAKKRLDLANCSRDKYFRLDCDVFVEGESLGQLLIKNNLAVPYDGGTKPLVDWCK